MSTVDRQLSEAGSLVQVVSRDCGDCGVWATVADLRALTATLRLLFHWKQEHSEQLHFSPIL